MLEKEKSIIIISTTISICIMLLTGIDKGQEKKVIKSYENNKNQTQIIIDKSKNANTTSKALVSVDKDKVINTLENKEIGITIKEAEQPIQDKPIEENNIDQNESAVPQLPEQNLNKDDNIEKTAPVFKVNSENIFSELSFVDKEKLFVISIKLKTSDYKKISNLLEGDVDGQGVLSSLRILKKRLSINDYSKIKQIFNKFINMDLVNN